MVRPMAGEQHYVPPQRNHVYYSALQVGRWLADKHPQIRNPADWTRELSVEWIACLDRLTIGQYIDPQIKRKRKLGEGPDAQSQTKSHQQRARVLQGSTGMGTDPAKV